jgi:hypothetical protein
MPCFSTIGSIRLRTPFARECATLGVREDGQKVLLAVKNMGGAPGLEKALAALWSDMPVQRYRDDHGGGAGRNSVAPPLWAAEGGRKHR